MDDGLGAGVGFDEIVGFTDGICDIDGRCEGCGDILGINDGYSDGCCVILGEAVGRPVGVFVGRCSSVHMNVVRSQTSNRMSQS